MGLSDIITGLVQPVTNFFNRRQEIKAQEHQNDVELLKAQGERQATLAREGLAADAAWEMEFARQAATSWKDDAELVVIMIPMVLCFHPKGAILVAEGFKALSGTPLWFQGLAVTIFLANYGIRNYRRTISDT